MKADMPREFKPSRSRGSRPQGKASPDDPGLILECDVLVVGAGPAGSSAARAAAAAGADTVMIDRRPAVGRPPRCAGYVPLPLMSRIPLSGDVVAQRIEQMVTHSPGGLEAVAAPGCIIHRDRFDQRLASAAVAAGARLLTGCRAAAHDGAATMVTGEAVTRGISARWTIGADGPRSTVGGWIGAVNEAMAVSAQWTVSLNERLPDIHVYFQRELPGGYGWLFPMKDRANVGIAVAAGSGIRPIVALRRFATSLAADGLISLEGVVATGGLIPVGGPLPCRSGAILLAGDAAGHCHPLTGAGIATAIQCGELAGEAAGESLATGSDAPLSQYELEVDELFGEHLRQAADHRRELYQGWQDPGKDIDQALVRAWIGFSGYNDHNHERRTDNKPR